MCLNFTTPIRTYLPSIVPPERSCSRSLRFNGVPTCVQLSVQEGPDLTATVHLGDGAAPLTPELLLRDFVDDVDLDTRCSVVQISPTRIAICGKRTAVCLLDLAKVQQAYTHAYPHAINFCAQQRFQVELMLDYVCLLPIYANSFLAIGGNRLHLIDVRTFGPPRWSQACVHTFILA